jgi:excisionase family DNA binding protein
MPTTLANPLMTRTEAAAYLGVKTQTLAVWVTRQVNGPPYVKIGRSVRYRKSDLDQYIADQTVRPGRR